MAGTLFWIDAIQVFIAAEDHPPPHVHAVHTGEGWVARFRFSFLSDVTGLYRFRRRGRKPTEATLDRVAEAIMAHLPACRESWWTTHGSRHEINLVNRRVETRRIEGGDGLLAKVALKPSKAAAGKSIELVLDADRIQLFDPNGGRNLTLTESEKADAPAA